MKKYCVLLAFIAASSLAFGQGYFAPAQTAFKVVNGYTTPIANATITVCAAAASGIPCSPVLTNTIFSNQALTQSLSNPFPTDPFGNYQFAAAPATYTVTITASGFAGYSYQTTIGGSGGGGGGGSTGGPNFSIQYNCSSIFCGNGNWLYSAPPSGSNGLGSVVDGGDMAIGANLNVGGSITQTQSGGWQLNGALLGSTTITVPPSYGFSLGVGLDGQFRCILLAGGSCLNAAQLAGTIPLAILPDLSNGGGGYPYVSQSQLGIANGVATLDGSGRLPVLEYQNYVPVLLPNDSAVGTFVNLLTATTSLGNAVTISTTSTYGIIGPCQSGCGITGTAVLAGDGVGLCTFDGATNAGDVVVPSTTVAGDCHDSGSVAPSPWLTQVGVVDQTMSAAGNANVRINVTPPASVATSYPNETSVGTQLYSLAKASGSGASGVLLAANGVPTGTWGAVALELKPSGSTPPTYVNGVICNTSFSGTSLSCTYAPTSGHVVILAMTWGSPPGASHTCADSGSNTVTASGTVSASGSVNQELFAYVSGAGITGFTCTWTTSRQAGVAVLEYAGASSSINFSPTNGVTGCTLGSSCTNPASINPLYSVTQDRMVAAFSKVTANFWSASTGNFDLNGGTSNANFAIVSASSGVGAPNSAKILATTDLRTIGVDIGNAGTSGTTSVCTLGICPCTFDATSVVINDFVQISSTVGGACHDAGSTRPTSGQILGTAQASGAGSAVYNVFFFGPDDFPGGGGPVATYSSGTQTGSIASTTLCSTSICGAGSYHVDIYANETGTGCTSVGSGAVKIQLNFVDNQGVTRSSVQIPNFSLGLVSGSGLNFTTTGTAFTQSPGIEINSNGTAVSGSDAIQILTTVAACSTPGSWTGYQLRAVVHN